MCIGAVDESDRERDTLKGKGTSPCLDPTLRIGEAAEWMMEKGLRLVSEEYRDQVEVLARVLYEPGGWMTVVEVGMVLFIILVVRRRNRERAKLQQKLKWEAAKRK